MKYRIKKAMLSMLAMVCGVCMLAGYASAKNNRDTSWAFSGYQAGFSTDYRSKEDTSPSYCKSKEGQAIRATVYRSKGGSDNGSKIASDTLQITVGHYRHLANYNKYGLDYAYAKLYLERTIEDKIYNRGVWSPDSRE